MGKTDSRVSATKRCILPADLLWRPGGDGICLSPVFVVDSQRWRVRLQCPLSLTCSSPYVSLLLAAAGGNTGHTRCKLTIINHIDRERDVVVQASQDFSQGGSGTSRSAMGDRAVVELETLKQTSNGFLQDGLLEVEVEVWQQAAGRAAGGAAGGSAYIPRGVGAAAEAQAGFGRKLRDSTTAAAKGKIRRRTRPAAAAGAAAAAGGSAMVDAVTDMLGVYMALDSKAAGPASQAATAAAALDESRRQRRRRAPRRLGPTNRLGGSGTAAAAVAMAGLDGDAVLSALMAGAQINTGGASPPAAESSIMSGDAASSGSPGSLTTAGAAWAQAAGAAMSPRGAAAAASSSSSSGGGDGGSVFFPAI